MSPISDLRYHYKESLNGDLYISLSTFLQMLIAYLLLGFVPFLHLKLKPPLPGLKSNLTRLKLFLKPCWLLLHEGSWSRGCHLHCQGCSPLWSGKKLVSTRAVGAGEITLQVASEVALAKANCFSPEPGYFCSHRVAPTPWMPI